MPVKDKRPWCSRGGPFGSECATAVCLLAVLMTQFVFPNLFLTLVHTSAGSINSKAWSCIWQMCARRRSMMARTTVEFAGVMTQYFNPLAAINPRVVAMQAVFLSHKHMGQTWNKARLISSLAYGVVVGDLAHWPDPAICNPCSSAPPVDCFASIQRCRLSLELDFL